MNVEKKDTDCLTKMAVKKVTSKSDLDAHINNMDVKATIVCVLHPR